MATHHQFQQHQSCCALQLQQRAVLELKKLHIVWLTCSTQGGKNNHKLKCANFHNKFLQFGWRNGVFNVNQKKKNNYKNSFNLKIIMVKHIVVKQSFKQWYYSSKTPLFFLLNQLALSIIWIYKSASVVLGYITNRI